MICIILAAGPPLGGFPLDSKPKCLFHYNGEVVLEHTVRVLRRCGVNDIRVVTGYKSEMIEQFNEERKLGLTLIHNPDGADDNKGGFRSEASGNGWRECYKSIRLGLSDINEDVIITVGDLWLRETSFHQFLASEERLVVGRGGHGLQIFKIGREHLPKLRLSQGRGCVRLLYFFCMAEKGVEGFQCDDDNFYTGLPGQPKHLEEHWMRMPELQDIDWYWQTDEGQKDGAKHS